MGNANGWVYPTTRWAVYLRDDLACVYCGVTMAQILDDYGDNFLTLDHVVPKRPKKGGRKGDNSTGNLVTACYHCNCGKGQDTLTAYGRSLGLSPAKVAALSARVLVRRKRPIEHYRHAAKVLLGRIPGLPMADMVYDHDWLVKRQWSESDLDGEYWTHIRADAQQALFCEACRRPHPTEAEQREAAAGRWSSVDDNHGQQPPGSYGGVPADYVWDDDKPLF